MKEYIIAKYYYVKQILVPFLRKLYERRIMKFDTVKVYMEEEYRNKKKT